MLCVFFTQWSGAVVLGAPVAIQLPAASSAPFPQDALPSNRSGRLTDQQLRNWRDIAREHRKSIRDFAYLAGGIGGVLLIADGPPSKALARHAVGVASLGVAALIILASNHDALSADLREGRVESVEGAIAKRTVHGRSWSTYYFEIDRRRLQVSRSGYNAAPDAGIIRAYYLPRSRRVVNLERLPDPALPAGPDATQHIVMELIAAVRSHDRVALAEARARAAALVDAIRGPAVGPGATTHLEADALYGSWTNPLITVTFARDGVATLDARAGPSRAGHWAIDADGRLLTDATGAMEPTEAWLEGNRLWISIDGKTVMFARVPAGIQIR